MKKYLKNIVCGLICASILVFNIFTKETLVDNIITIEPKKYIIELWHVDTFDGGKGSRKDFLLSSALKFEKKENVIISVISHTIESATKQLQISVPDLISCGAGLDILNIVHSIPIKTQNNVCKIGKNNFGASWCRGGYALIGEGEKKNLIVSQGDYTLPLLALKESKNSFSTIEVLPSNKAYLEYLKKGGYLLGTQRDIIRLTNLGRELKYEPISQFCDLYQVICLTTKTKEKISVCESFISFLLSPERQKALSNIAMLSTTGQKLYKDTPLEELEKVVIEKSQNFFTDPNVLKNINFNLKEELKTC